MKIHIVTVQAPFVWGGAEYLAESLAERLEAAGHRVDTVRIPFKWYPERAIPEHMLACRLLSLSAGEPDLVIALKFPAYLVPFANKKIWLLHQFRQAYELWGTDYGWPDNEGTRTARAAIVEADNRCLREARALYTNSKIVADRLMRFNRIKADDVLYPPLRRPELFRCLDPGNYFFYPSRLNGMKRQAIAVEAMRFVKSDFQLVLAGKADQEEYQTTLDNLVRKYRLEDRVKFLGWISEEEKAERMARAVGVLYLPFDEDSYGYVTLEAFHSAKPVITFRDSGGTNELLEPGHNGLVLEPTPEALAEGMERLWADKNGTCAKGRAARDTLRQKNITWDQVLERLVA